jgi:hypothetical protein
MKSRVSCSPGGFSREQCRVADAQAAKLAKRYQRYQIVSRGERGENGVTPEKGMVTRLGVEPGTAGLRGIAAKLIRNP